MAHKRVLCRYNKEGAWCTNKNIKRSFFGLGARCCSEFYDENCNLKESRPKPKLPDGINRSSL